jgi:DNA polymerase-3 subunit gamma/tau
MEYIVSARKYRPATFRSVVGQGNITTTLKNAIKSSHLAHAYLFCGSRGVGKTTCARIFAKTINCFNISEDFEACNTCESCQSFNDNRSYNIHELDAASNNSVDDIRSLIDKVRVPPQLGHYSVYIIDEVHMLSQAAFNAFLKTLEEPPRHAIFILATTEKHKILPTILSRCQIFDFNRITIADAVVHLKYVSESEGVKIEEEGLAVIAQKADGAMRDALSIFDQIVAFSGKEITYQQVIENLNVLDYDYYFRLTDDFLAEDYKQALLTFNTILLKGFDAQHFMAGLNSHMRDLLMCRDASTAGLLEVSESAKQKYIQQAASCSVDFLYEALKIINDSEQQYRAAKNKRLHIEFALIRLARIVTEKKN